MKSRSEAFVGLLYSANTPDGVLARVAKFVDQQKADGPAIPHSLKVTWLVANNDTLVAIIEWSEP